MGKGATFFCLFLTTLKIQLIQAGLFLSVAIPLEAKLAIPLSQTVKTCFVVWALQVHNNTIRRLFLL
jgi:hypothetical protein